MKLRLEVFEGAPKDAVAELNAWFAAHDATAEPVAPPLLNFGVVDGATVLTIILTVQCAGGNKPQIAIAQMRGNGVVH